MTMMQQHNSNGHKNAFPTVIVWMILGGLCLLLCLLNVYTMSYCHSPASTAPTIHLLQVQAPKQRELVTQKRTTNDDDKTQQQQSVSCSDILANPSSLLWPDPNEGQSFLRRMVQVPPFAVSTHTEAYDPVRWKYLFQQGRYYEDLVFDRFQRILNSTRNELVVDVGANIGYYTLLSAALGHTVLAFEINPANIRRLCESLRWNAFEESVTIFQRGVADVTGQRLQVIVPKNPGQAFMKENVQEEDADASIDAHHAWTTTLTLDDFARQQGWLLDTAQLEIALLKMDVEGKEPNIIQGATRLLRSGRVRNVLTELRRLSRPSVQEAIAVLLEAGYTLVDERRPTQPDATETKQILDDLKVKLKGSQKNIDLWFTRDPPSKYS